MSPLFKKPPFPLGVIPSGPEAGTNYSTNEPCPQNPTKVGIKADHPTDLVAKVIGSAKKGSPTNIGCYNIKEALDIQLQFYRGWVADTGLLSMTVLVFHDPSGRANIPYIILRTGSFSDQTMYERGIPDSEWNARVQKYLHGKRFWGSEGYSNYCMPGQGLSSSSQFDEKISLIEQEIYQLYAVIAVEGKAPHGITPS